MATSREIAKLAGVSQATVSRVLLGATNVSDATRERVERVMAEVGYVPNAQARAMRTNRTRSIGVVTGRITNPFYPEFLNGLAGSIARADYRMALWTADEQASEAAAVEAIRARLVDGLIFTTATPDSVALASAQELGIPVVLANRSLEGVDCDQVTSNNLEGGALVARYFLGNGRTNAAIVGGRETVSTGWERRQGFIREFREAGVDLPEDWSPEVDFLHDAARSAGERLLRSPSHPAAVFCVNDLIAFGVIDAARRTGTRIPEELWVVGYDDIAMAAWDVFDLTTVRQPIDSMASTAVQMLIDRISGDAKEFEHRLFDPELVIRGSTARTSAREPAAVDVDELAGDVGRLT